MNLSRDSADSQVGGGFEGPTGGSPIRGSSIWVNRGPGGRRTEAIAEEALGLIRVDYEPIPGVYDPLEAMKPDAPQVEEGRSNIITQL